MKPRASSEDYEEDWNPEVLSGSLEVGDPYETPCLLDHHGNPIEPTPTPIGFTK